MPVPVRVTIRLSNGERAAVDAWDVAPLAPLLASALYKRIDRVFEASDRDGDGCWELGDGSDDELDDEGGCEYGCRCGCGSGCGCGCEYGCEEECDEEADGDLIVVVEEVDSEWERDEVEEVDGDEIEIEGGVEGEGGGWGKGVGVDVCMRMGMRRWEAGTLWERCVMGFWRYWGDL